jgi:ATP-dependent Clp protease ATP-binding subunit ClpC
LTQAERALKTTFSKKYFKVPHTAHLLLYFKKRKRSNNQAIKLKIDYDIAKEQYLNMTPNEEDFIENYKK